MQPRYACRRYKNLMHVHVYTIIVHKTLFLFAPGECVASRMQDRVLSVAAAFRIRFPATIKKTTVYMFKPYNLFVVLTRKHLYNIHTCVQCSLQHFNFIHFIPCSILTRSLNLSSPLCRLKIWHQQQRNSD